MTVVRRLLGKGNSKLGEAVHTWSLPAVETCPGASDLCVRNCYARGGRYRTHRMREWLAENLEAAERPDFESRMLREIMRRCVLLCRVHVAGDLYSPAYAAKWVRIFRRAKRTRFWLYTRSWRKAEFLPSLVDMTALPNVQLWLSCDEDTGPPPLLPGARVAWLEEDDGDADDLASDLVFRIKRIRNQKPWLTPLRLVCPTDRPDELDVDCGSCGRCWKEDER